MKKCMSVVHIRKFLISATDGGKWLVSSSGRFTPSQYAKNRSQGGYRIGLDAVDNNKNCFPVARNRTWILWSPARILLSYHMLKEKLWICGWKRKRISCKCNFEFGAGFLLPRPRRQVADSFQLINKSRYNASVSGYRTPILQYSIP
jgi:hypothetical protein